METEFWTSNLRVNAETIRPICVGGHLSLERENKAPPLPPLPRAERSTALNRSKTMSEEIPISFSGRIMSRLKPPVRLWESSVLQLRNGAESGAFTSHG